MIWYECGWWVVIVDDVDCWFVVLVEGCVVQLREVGGAELGLDCVASVGEFVAVVVVLN